MSEAWDGRPLNPERDGWHWLGGPVGSQSIHYWMGDIQRWETASGSCWTPEYFAARSSYLGPCLTPDQVAAAVQAERDFTLRCLMAHRFPSPDGERQHAMNDALQAVINTIRARGETSALDEAIKAARVEGMREAYRRANAIIRHECSAFSEWSASELSIAAQAAIRAEACGKYADSSAIDAIRAGIEEAKGGGAHG